MENCGRNIWHDFLHRNNQVSLLKYLFQIYMEYISFKILTYYCDLFHIIYNILRKKNWFSLNMYFTKNSAYVHFSLIPKHNPAVHLSFFTSLDLVNCIDSMFPRTFGDYCYILATKDVSFVRCNACRDRPDWLPICLEGSRHVARRRGINRNVGQGRWHPRVPETGFRGPPSAVLPGKRGQRRFRFVFTVREWNFVKTVASSAPIDPRNFTRIVLNRLNKSSVPLTRASTAMLRRNVMMSRRKIMNFSRTYIYGRPRSSFLVEISQSI